MQIEAEKLRNFSSVGKTEAHGRTCPAAETRCSATTTSEVVIAAVITYAQLDNLRPVDC